MAGPATPSGRSRGAFRAAGQAKAHRARVTTVTTSSATVSMRRACGGAAGDGVDMGFSKAKGGGGASEEDWRACGRGEKACGSERAAGEL
ncbi:hypothetical protein GCM10010252_59160 [Streptomyces aureoverticillatus]|nr:hypothetical protein GCM10010252_59160 [Streptomyces aureoverticillatus]